MQIKVFSVPVVGGEAVNDELNAFLRGNKILQVEQQLVASAEGTYWSFCIRYIGKSSGSDKTEKRVRKDYKKELSPKAFERFSILRKIRKQVAEEDGVPAFAVFTDEELAGLALLEEITPTNMKTVRGIGDKKVEKYAERFQKALKDASSE
jgi:superfamily II DNA helicase RecQ